MKASITPEMERARIAEVVKPPTKHGASPFDHALHQVAPKKQPHEAQARAPQQQAKDGKQRPPAPPRPVEDGLRSARLFAALHGIPLTALVVPRAMPDARLSSGETEAVALDGTSAMHDDIPTTPTAQPKVASPDEDAEDEGLFALPNDMAPTDDTLVDPPAAAAPEVDPEQVAQLIASMHVADSQKTNDATRHDATVDVAALEGAVRTNVAEPTRAVEAAPPVREAQWDGLADSIANGSIEGNRARVVIGQGDDRIVLTVATHAHRVQLDVETSTAAGQKLAEQLREGSSDLRHALQRHGLDLADHGAPPREEAERDEASLQPQPKKQANPTIARPTGLVA